ncbi:hypothetical protein ACIBEA_29885 [Streptomyces sp. NPDC051555]|uniref:hypothetical protein n=1 Tax=Streptomyces sp. NPDC051555 TaxID=3365657 RepID=UPI0037AA413D
MMGNAYYKVTRDGETIEAGYDVAATCERDDCDTAIDRGLAYLCGRTPGGDECGCGGYYCERHLYMSGEDEVGDLCGPCITTYRRQDPLGS